MSISNGLEGGGVVDRPHPFRIDATDENAVLIRGILAAADGNSLDSEDEGRWFFSLQTRISDYADAIARLREVTPRQPFPTLCKHLRSCATRPPTRAGRSPMPWWPCWRLHHRRN